MATATKSQNRQDEKAQPAFACRHRRLQIAVWQNDSSNGTFFTASMQRSYKDGEEWKRTQATLNRDDLLVTAKLLNWAHSAVATAVSTKATPPTAKHPVSSQRYRNLEVAVWRRDGEDDAFYTVSLKRSYKVDDKWNDSTISLSNDDLLPMARLLERAHDAIDDLYEDGDFTSQEPSNGDSSNSNDTPF
jgi:hypothetical protein